MGLIDKILKNKKIIFLTILSILICALGGIFYYRISERLRHEFKVTFLNIGQGDSALIQFADGETMLVDCGPDSTVLSQLGRALPLYVKTIDYVLATHPDLDHYGGCVDVLKRYNVKHIIVNGREKKNDPYWQEWNRAMHAEPGADITVMHAPQTWTIASSTLQFLSPDDSFNLDVKADDSNNYSIVFKLTANTGRSFMFTGDMEMPLEEALIQKYCSSSLPLLFQGGERPARNASRSEAGGGGLPSALTLVPQSTATPPNPAYRTGRLPLVRGGNQCPMLKSDILKVGHHGSKSSSGEDFLTLVRPKKAIISVGKNKYGHPSLMVIKHLERLGIEVLRTDELGAIVEK